MSQEVSKIEKLENQYKSAKEKEKYFKERSKTLRLQIESQKAKSILKAVDEAGLNIEEAKSIIKDNSKENKALKADNN